jgi:hypothetical protein
MRPASEAPLGRARRSYAGGVPTPSSRIIFPASVADADDHRPTGVLGGIGERLGEAEVDGTLHGPAVTSADVDPEVDIQARCRDEGARGRWQAVSTIGELSTAETGGRERLRHPREGTVRIEGRSAAVRPAAARARPTADGVRHRRSTT